MGSNLNTSASIEECPQGLRDNGLISENVPQGMESVPESEVGLGGETSLILGLSYRLPWVGQGEGHLLKLTPNVLVTETSPYLLVPSNLLKRVA